MNEADVRDALAVSSEFAKKHTGPATAEVVSAAPGVSPSESPKRIVVDALFVSGSAAGTIQLLDGDGAAVDGYFFCWAAGGNVNLTKAFLKKLPASKGLKYSTTDGGNHAVVIKYHEEIRS